MDKEVLKMTELDSLTSAPHMQMIKAALPYIHIPEQRFFSLIVKFSELERTIRLFDQKNREAVGICSLGEDEPASPIDMLTAMKPYGTEEEQDMIDLMINFMQGARLSQSYREMQAAGQQEGAGPEDSNFSAVETDGSSSPWDTVSAAQAGSESRNTESFQGTTGTSGPRIPFEYLKGMLPSEQQARLETMQMLLQAFRPGMQQSSHSS